MKRPYECLFIIDSDISEEKRAELIVKFAKMASSSTKTEKWGMKKFATPINYKKEGFYVLMNFDAEPEVPEKIAKLMNITEGVVRYMFVDKSEQVRRIETKKEKKQ